MSVPVSLKKFIKSNGKIYEPAYLPEEIPRGMVGNCFDWCIIQALRSNLIYVEGLASDPHNPNHYILHAWLTDPDGRYALDPTWGVRDDNTGEIHPLPIKYIGIEFDSLAVARFMKATGYQGLIANRWRAPELFDKAVLRHEQLSIR